MTAPQFRRSGYNTKANKLDQAYAFSGLEWVNGEESRKLPLDVYAHVRVEQRLDRN